MIYRRRQSAAIHRTRAGPSTERGFSLLEAIVATGLAGMIAMGVVTMMAFSINAGGVSEEMTELTAVAVDQLEVLNSLSFSGDALRQGGSLTDSERDYSVDPVPGAPNVFLRWQIEDVSPTLKRINLVAGYRAGTMGSRQVEMETFRVLSQ